MGQFLREDSCTGVMWLEGSSAWRRLSTWNWGGWHSRAFSLSFLVLHRPGSGLSAAGSPRDVEPSCGAPGFPQSAVFPEGRKWKLPMS